MRGTVGAAMFALALTGCAGTAQQPAPTPTTTATRTGNPAACKAALEQLYADAVTSSRTGAPPTACQGVDDATVRKYVGEIVTKALEDLGTETITP